MTFKPGQSGNPNGRRRGRLDNRTIAREDRLRELSKRIGTPIDAHDLLTKIIKDPDAPLDLKVDCAAIAIRFETPALSLTNAQSVEALIKPPGQKPDVSMLSDEQRAMLAFLLSKVLGFDNKPTINASLPAPTRSHAPEPAKEQWIELLSQAEERGVPEHEIARYREQFRQAFPDE